MVRNRHVSVRYRTVPHTAFWLRNIIPTGLNHVTSYHVTSGDSFIYMVSREVTSHGLRIIITPGIESGECDIDCSIQLLLIPFL